MAEPQVLVVDAEEARRQLGTHRFLGLPAEEIQRLYASIEVRAMGHEEAARDPSCLLLATYTAIHFNHVWLTSLRAGLRSMGIGGEVQGGADCLFLDDHPTLAARRHVEQAVAGQAFDLRLAGLIQGEPRAAGGIRLGLVYVAKLRQAVPLANNLGDPTARLCGHGDLERERDQFEPWSQVLIDNLHAL